MNKSWYLKYVFFMASLFAVTIGYNACSNDASFDLKQGVDSLETYGGGTPIGGRNPSVLIDGDAGYTQQEDVSLALNPDGLADAMIISTSPDCSGTWEPFQANIPYQLTEQNKETRVYAQFRYQDEAPTPCVSDSIIHDDTPPVVNFVQGGETLWIKERNVNVIFEATDNASGIRITECDKSGSGQFSQCGTQISYIGLQENDNNVLIVRATDNAGNVSSTEQINWRLDSTPPTVVFNRVPAVLTADSSPDFEFTGTDNGSGLKGYECRLDQAQQYTACQNTLTLSNLADGPHSLSVRAIDNVDHVSTAITHNWVQDSTAPTIEFTQTPNALESSNQATFAFQGINANQGIVSYTCQVDGGAGASCTSPNVLSGLTDGAHSIAVIGYDAVGNASSPISYNWTIDTQKPNIMFVEVPNALTNSPDAVVSVSVTDASGVASVECQLDGQAYKTCQLTEVLTGLAAGAHTISYRATDNAGNTSDPISHQWNIDMTPPVVTITDAPAPYTTETTANFQFTATDANGVALIECRVDGGAYQACTSPHMISGVTEGNHTLFVRARDNAGNVSGAQTTSWTVDTTGPQITFIIQPDAISYVGNTSQVRFSVDDGGGSGFNSATCMLNGVAVACAPDATLDIPETVPGNSTFVVTVTDNLGNQSTSQVPWQTIQRFSTYQTNRMIDGSNPMVDILFVIDTSGSMNYERSSLANRFAGFIDKIKDLDWQIAVTTTDVVNNYTNNPNRQYTKGKLDVLTTQNGQGIQILTSAMDPVFAQQTFGNRIQSYPEGDWREQGIYATALAIDRFVAGENVHGQFFRSNANLAVVVLTDEDENSNGSNLQYTPQAFLDHVNTSFGGQKNIQWHSIVVNSGDQACDDVRNHVPGAQYELLSSLTGGIVGSVCATDYATQLQNMGTAVQQSQRDVTLQCPPVDSDGDGNVNLTVTHDADGDGVYDPYLAPYTLQGRTITFADYLPDGDFQFNYSCATSGGP